MHPCPIPSQFIFQTVSSQSHPPHPPGTFFLGAVDYHLGLAETFEEGRRRTVQYRAGIGKSTEKCLGSAAHTTVLRLVTLRLPRKGRRVEKGS